MSPPRVRLVVGGTQERPLMMMTEPIVLPPEYWSPIETGTNARSFATRLPRDLEERTAAFRASPIPVGWRRLMLDVEGDGDYLLGATNVGTGEVTPGRMAALVSWIAERAEFHPRGWHTDRELRVMCDAHPESDEEARRLAWETRTCANLLLGAIRNDVHGTAWLDLGAAVIARIPQRRTEVRRRIAETAESEGTTYQDAIEKLAAGGALAAAADLRSGGRFRLGNRPTEVDAMRLPELARAFRSRAVRSVLETIGYDRRSRPQPPVIEPRDPLAALEIAAPEALRAVATPAEHRVLDALEAAAAAGYGEDEARRVAAEDLDISASTLRVHIRNLRKKASA